VSFTLRLLYSQGDRIGSRARLHLVTSTGNGNSTSVYYSITHMCPPQHACRLKESGTTFPYIPLHVHHKTLSTNGDKEVKLSLYDMKTCREVVRGMHIGYWWGSQKEGDH
jgi:hypothetical protein